MRVRRCCAGPAAARASMLQTRLSHQSCQLQSVAWHGLHSAARCADCTENSHTCAHGAPTTCLLGLLIFPLPWRSPPDLGEFRIADGRCPCSILCVIQKRCEAASAGSIMLWVRSTTTDHRIVDCCCSMCIWLFQRATCRCSFVPRTASRTLQGNVAVRRQGFAKSL